MSEQDDTGTRQALLERLVKFRLPQALAILKRVDAGESLDDSDIAFLKSALEDARNGHKYVASDRQLHALGGQLVQLYDDIVRRATENERAKR